MKRNTKLTSFLSSKLNLFISFMLSAVLLSSCMKSDNNDNQPEFKTALSVVNASPGPMAFNFSLSNRRVDGPALEYTQESGYFLTYHGIRDFEVIPSGGAGGSLKTSIELKEETYQTLFIAGENSALTSLFTEDDLSDPPAGKAKIRFVNLSPDSGEQTLAIKAGSDLFTDQPFKSATEFITIDPGTYDLQLKNATGNILTEINAVVAEGTIYTAWSKGLISGTGGTPIGLQFRSIN